MVHQNLPVRLIATIVTIAISGSECKLSKHHKRAQAIINIIQAVSTTICIVGILQQTKMLKLALGGYKIITKLLALKLIIFLDVLQSLIFSILSNTGDIKPTKTQSLPDLLIGTPELIVCCECFIFSLLYFWPYSARSYTARKHDANQQSYPRMGFFRAIIDVMNISDIITGGFYMVVAWREGRYEKFTPVDSRKF